MKRLNKLNNEARQVWEEEEDSDDSLDLERESENEAAEVAEESKSYEKSNKNQDTSFHTQQYTNNTKKMFSKKQTNAEDQYSTSDLFAPDKKLKITEKKLFVKQIVLSSSLNTSLNPHKVMNAPVAELNFELVIEGE